MAVPVQQQSQSAVSTAVVEEKFYDLSLADHERSLRKAIEHAAGMPVDELAPGMWFGSRKVDRWTSIEVTARAQAVDDGTSVELRVEHKVSPLATTLAITGLVLGSVLIVPLFAIIAYAQRANQRQQRERLVLMHKMWREIAEVVDAPRRSSYREAPKRVYVPEAQDRRAAPDAQPEAEPAETADPLRAER